MAISVFIAETKNESFLFSNSIDNYWKIPLCVELRKTLTLCDFEWCCIVALESMFGIETRSNLHTQSYFSDFSKKKILIVFWIRVKAERKWMGEKPRYIQLQLQRPVSDTRVIRHLVNIFRWPNTRTVLCFDCEIKKRWSYPHVLYRYGHMLKM